MKESRPSNKSLEEPLLTFPSQLPRDSQVGFFAKHKSIFFPLSNAPLLKVKMNKRSPGSSEGRVGCFQSSHCVPAEVFGAMQASPAPAPGVIPALTIVRCFQQEIWAIWELHSPGERRDPFK